MYFRAVIAGDVTSQNEPTLKVHHGVESFLQLRVLLHVLRELRNCKTTQSSGNPWCFAKLTLIAHEGEEGALAAIVNLDILYVDAGEGLLDLLP